MPRKSKKTSVKTPASQNTAKELPKVNSVLQFFHFSGIRKFFSQRKNIILTLTVLVVFSLLYLFKDVFIVAVVNGQPIYRWTVIHRLEQQGGSQILDALVTETLVRQAIKTAGVQANQADIDASIQEIEDRLTQQGMTLDQALEQEGMTRQQLEDDIRLQRSAEQVVAANVTVTDEEVDQYIADNQEYLPEGMTEAELRDSVRQQLYSQKMSEAIQEWVAGLQEEAKILYLKKYSL